MSGVVVAAGMWGTLLAFGGDMPHGWFGMALGYLSMLVALSAVFVGIKNHRDVDRGGVIGFWPAFGLGLGISLVAGIFRSEGRRVGKECVSTCRYRWSPYT